MDSLTLDLNIELKDVDTSMPRLESNTYLLGIKEVKIEPSKQGEGKRNLLVVFATKEEANSTAGGTISPGFQLRKYYPLQQSPKENAPDFRRDISILIDAAFAVTAESRPDLTSDTLSGLVGREVVASVKVKQDDTYGEVNEIGMLKAVEG